MEITFIRTQVGVVGMAGGGMGRVGGEQAALMGDTVVVTIMRIGTEILGIGILVEIGEIAMASARREIYKVMFVIRRK